MGKSLFTIQEEIYKILDEIYEGDGEITPELEERLNISQAELAEKGKNYLDIIKDLDSKINASKEEICRCQAFKKTQENKRKRLATSLIDAINMFGNTTKSGVKFIEGSTYKISARPSASTELNDSLIRAIIDETFKIFKESYDADVVGVDDFSLPDVAHIVSINILNDPERAYLLETGNIDESGNKLYREVTVDDLTAIEVEISFTINLYKLCEKSKATLVDACFDYDWICSIKSTTSKSSCNAFIKDDRDMTIADRVINYSLQIK